MIKIENSFKGEGFIDSLRITKKCGEVKTDLSFKNTFLDSGIRKLVNDSYPHTINTLFSRLYFGSGTTPPSREQVDLVSKDELGRHLSGSDAENFRTVYVSDEEFYKEATLTFSSSEGGASGSWSEIGLAYSDGTMLTRALIKDEAGNPITVNILDDEYLNIKYTVRVHFRVPYQTGSINILGINHTYKVYPHFDKNNSIGFGINSVSYPTFNYIDPVDMSFLPGLNTGDLINFSTNMGSHQGESTNNFTHVSALFEESPVGSGSWVYEGESIAEPRNGDRWVRSVAFGSDLTTSYQSNPIGVIVFDSPVYFPPDHRARFGARITSSII